MKNKYFHLYKILPLFENRKFIFVRINQKKSLTFEKLIFFSYFKILKIKNQKYQIQIISRINS